MAHKRVPWTEEDIKNYHKYRNEGKTLRQISEIMNRTFRSVKTRYEIEKGHRLTPNVQIQSDPKSRKCLKCGNHFKSKDKGHRICNSCKKTKEYNWYKDVESYSVNLQY